jgi:3-oxoacid CoA-transferase subunit A
MKFYVTGDKHGQFHTILQNEIVKDPNNAIIILGDAGINYYLRDLDDRLKKEISENSKCMWYIVRGNHEARPQDVSVPYEIIWDPWVSGQVYVQEEYPNIRFFLDFGEYFINGSHVAVIGGAYSVDKWWRLARAGVLKKSDLNYNNPKRTGWFPNEQLSKEEMERANYVFEGKIFDFIFSHTCPLSFQPTDLFLSAVNQSEVDTSMEQWMEQLKDKMEWFVWLYGHYHNDRMERPYVEMYYHDIDALDDIKARWVKYAETGELDWWLEKSPNFYMK